MPNFSAQAEVYKAVMKEPSGHRFTPALTPIHTGSVAECVRYVVTKHDGYPATYTMRVPLEAGFQTNTLHYRDIEAISKRPDFPGA